MLVRRSLVVLALTLAVVRCTDQPTALQQSLQSPQVPQVPQYVRWARNVAPQFTAISDQVQSKHHGRPDRSPPLSLDTYSVSFWAVRGEARSVSINYASAIDTLTHPFMQLTVSDPTFVPGQGALATSVADKWAKYRQNLALTSLQALRASGAVYNHWDDHEFVNDFTQAENGNAIYQAGVQAFTNYMPAHYASADGLYNSERWGKNLEVFRLDERSFRSAKASANHTCDNPQTGKPDLAPTAPQSTRNLFALLVPSLAQPVSQACKDKINDPNRTMLGSAQFDRFTQAIKNSDATFKVVLNEVPIQQYYADPYDRWEGYEAERQRLLHFLQDNNVKNVIFLTTDTHANLVNVIRYKTLEPGGPQASPYHEFVTGPVSTMTYRREIDRTTGVTGAGNLIAAAFFKPPPPAGMGMDCVNVDIYSYAEVQVNGTVLTVTAKDVHGNVVRDQTTNTPCVLALPAL